MAIDLSGIPTRVMLDSSVLTRTREDSTEPHSELCRELWRALIKEHHQILIPAVALAEYMHHPPHQQPKRHRSVEIVTFDERTAEVLAGFPAHVFVKNTSNGETKALVKFDSMILASAVRHKAEMLFCMDTRLANLAISMNMPVMNPLSLPRQLTLLDAPSPAERRAAPAAPPRATSPSTSE